MTDRFGLTQSGLKLALQLKQSYAAKQPLILLDESHRLLMPEHLLNPQIDLQTFEDPMPLAIVAVRDPDSPMSIAAAVRMAPKARDRQLVSNLFEMLGETSKHSVVRKCIDLVTEHDFDPEVVNRVRRSASRFVNMSRKQYMDALKRNLRALMEGTMEPRCFVDDFFELSEAGNLRLDIRKRLVMGILTSESVRPSIKFLFLENLVRLPEALRVEIITDVLRTPDTRNLSVIKQELLWIKREASVH